MLSLLKTIFNKAKYTGINVSELKRLKALEDENRRLKQIVADQALDIQGPSLEGISVSG